MSTDSCRSIMCDSTKPVAAERADSEETSPPLSGSWIRSSFETNFFHDGLFVDYHFPRGSVERPGLVWKRAKDICPSARFIVDGATRMDVCQGELNDCWFLSALASLSLHRPLLENVVPTGQNFHKDYNGCFTFRFWQYGEWVEVKIDDFLPTQKDQLVYLRSASREEFWSPLLEKAYAKLKGGYLALNMGFPHEALVDMTGGVTEVFSVARLPSDLTSFLERLLKKSALINCANSQGQLEEKNEFGIMFRHAYSLTGVEKVKTEHGVVELVRVRNPWGRVEWEGPWSDLSGPEWGQVSDEEQKRVERVSVEDGEFWMSVPDFRQNFEMMEVCHLSDDTLSEPTATKRPWHCTMHHGKWVRLLSAGGPPQGERFWQNPQFNLTLLEEDDDPSDPELTCTFLVALMQKHKRRTGVQLNLNLHIYKARSGSRYLSSLDLTLLQPVLSLPVFSQQREVVLRGRLAPGHYVIIPFTAEANQEGEFVLRILTEKGNNAVPADKPNADENCPTEPTSPTQPLLPAIETTRRLFKKHCNSKRCCRPAELLNLLREAIGAVLAGYEDGFCLEHCKSFVALMDSNGSGQLDWEEFQGLWEKFRKWTYIFVKFDKNKSKSLDHREITPALTAAGLRVDEFVIQLISMRYMEPDMTVSYPGFLQLLLKLDTMIHKFHLLDMVGMGTISVNYRQWLHMTMYN